MVDGPLPAGDSHGPPAWLVGHQLVDPRRQVAFEGIRISGLERPAARGFEWHEQPRLALDDDFRDPAHGARDDRRLARHRLEVDDPERLVDRRAGKHGRVRVQLADRRLVDHLGDPVHVRVDALCLAHGRLHLRGDLRRVGRARAEHDRGPRREVADRPDEMDDALLARDPADEQDVRHGRVDPVPLQRVGRLLGAVLVGVDPVVDDRDPLLGDVEVGEDVVLRALRHRDDGVGHLERRPLHP